MLFFTLTLDTEEKTKFELLYERYHRRMLYLAATMLGDQMAAEDAVHSSFVKILEHLDGIADVDSGRTRRYVLTITERTALDMLRKKHREPMISYEEWAEWEQFLRSQEGFYELPEENQVVLAMKHMPLLYRDVFLLKYSSGYENREIASLLGISEASVRKRLSRGRQKLEEVLNGEGML